MNDKAEVEALASLLEGSGLMENISGGKRSHKAQYVRWLLGKVVERNPSARIKDEKGKVIYNPPYNPPFKTARVQPEATSERFGAVPRSEFINKMMAIEEGRKPLTKQIQKEVNVRTEKDRNKIIIDFIKQGKTTRWITDKLNRFPYRMGAKLVPNSQPTVARIGKKWKDGEINDDGSFA